MKLTLWRSWWQLLGHEQRVVRHAQLELRSLVRVRIRSHHIHMRSSILDQELGQRRRMLRRRRQGPIKKEKASLVVVYVTFLAFILIVDNVTFKLD